MKKLITILLVTVLTSCGTPPKSNTDYIHIIGEPIKIGNLEIAQYDFPVAMTWEEANPACFELGLGWRLPTRDEFNILYQNKKKIGGFNNQELYRYWSSTVVDSANKTKSYWTQSFFDGRQFGFTSNYYPNLVRTVRTIK